MVYNNYYVHYNSGVSAVERVHLTVSKLMEIQSGHLELSYNYYYD